VSTKFSFVSMAALMSTCLNVSHGEHARPWNCVSSSHLQLAKSMLLSADMQITHRQYAVALGFLNDGLHILEYRMMPNGNDDSGMYLGLADSKEKQGNLQLAATMKRSILAERISNSFLSPSNECSSK
jgi:hypothetical protein